MTIPAWISLIPLETVGSTNSYAATLAREGSRIGSCVWALEQTAGRGRYNRSWVSPRGNLYCSLILPEIDPDALAQLSFVTSLAITLTLNALLQSDYRCQTKWPNDVVVDRRKIAGILIESVPQRPCCVLGVGVNVLTVPEGDKPWSALADLSSRKVVVSDVLDRFLAAFDLWYHRWRLHGFSVIRPLWLENAVLWKQTITLRLQTNQSLLRGRFETIADNGDLGLRSLKGLEWIRLAEMVEPCS